ncbi:ABC transporter substrate-binding protein [Specibacter sp. RAF43]|uniref:ABC transporter substrate-binding protein n=1 Tax=Specibacter sp. RAF43 TaxID=3233057 RepID=UPI003F9632E2
MKRRSVLQLLAVAVVVPFGVAACGSSGAKTSGTVRVTLANHVWTDGIKAAIPEFEKESGLKVELTQLGEDQLSDQYNVKLNAGSDEIDVMMYRPLQEGKSFARNKYLADLTKNVNADAGWDWKDFQKGPVTACTFENKVVGVPIITEREVLYYRKDLLEAAGVAVPKTMEELEAAAKKIAAANKGVAGFVARTGKSAAVTQFSSFLYSFGGDFMDDAGKSTIATPEAKAAYAFYGGLIHNHGPANVSTDMSWPEAMAIFTQGNAAFYTEADSLYKNATDTSKSKVADKVGFAALPAGPAGSKPYNVPSWGLAINEASGNQENAWKFIQWATSKARTLAAQKAGVPGPRASVWADPEGTSTYPKDLAEAIAFSAEHGIGHDRPLVIAVGKAREIVGEPIVTAITGGDSAAAATSSNDQFQKFLDSDS